MQQQIQIARAARRAQEDSLEMRSALYFATDISDINKAHSDGHGYNTIIIN